MLLLGSFTASLYLKASEARETYSLLHVGKPLHAIGKDVIESSGQAHLKLGLVEGQVNAMLSPLSTVSVKHVNKLN